MQRRVGLRWVVLCMVALTTGLLLWFVRAASERLWYLPASLLLACTLIGAHLATRWHEASNRDALTGLFNRRHLTTHMDLQVRRSIRRQQPLSLVVIDIDDFKRFNDQYGHAVGDAVLVALAKLLQETVRQSDWIVRWGGEEFAVVLPNTSQARAVTVAERLRLRAHAVRLREHGNLRVTISLGVATCPEHALSASMLMAQGDAAMYQAKEQKDTVVAAAPPDTNAACTSNNKRVAQHV